MFFKRYFEYKATTNTGGWKHEFMNHEFKRKSKHNLQWLYFVPLWIVKILYGVRRFS